MRRLRTHNRSRAAWSIGRPVPQKSALAADSTWAHKRIVIHVLALSGSLRKASYNTALIGAAERLCPDGMAIQRFSLSKLPLYDDDVRLAGYPSNVQALRDAVARADAVLFASPEYNYSVSGVLKNAIDWVSRPPSQPFAGKPVAIVSASLGMLGGGRGQYHLRQVGVALDMRILNKPEVMVSRASEKFDKDLLLTDADTQKQLRSVLEALLDWTQKLKS